MILPCPIHKLYGFILDEILSHSDHFKVLGTTTIIGKDLRGVVGAITADAKYHTWGQKAFENAIGNIQEDGSLPKELERGRRALHYHEQNKRPSPDLYQNPLPKKVKSPA